MEVMGGGHPIEEEGDPMEGEGRGGGHPMEDRETPGKEREGGTL